MKTISFLFLFLVLLPISATGVPLYLSHQGRLLGPDQTPLAGVETIRFALYDQNESSLWSETLSVTLDNGFYHVILGEEEAFEPSDFDHEAVYLGVKVGDNDEMTPMFRVTSGAYAIWASKAATPTQDDDIATKAYVDQAHDEIYYTQTQMNNSDGDPPNEGSNLISWNNLTDVPEGLADGTDDGGIAGTGTVNSLAKFTEEEVLGDSILFENNGSIGIGTTDPQSALQVSGGIQLANDDAECTEDKSGTLRWNSPNLEMCNGFRWALVSSVPEEVILEFAYTGANQSWTVPDGVTEFQVFMWGAAGANTKNGGNAGSDDYVGGAGGYTYGIRECSPGEEYVIVVGSGGATGEAADIYGGGRGPGSSSGSSGTGGGYTGLFLSSVSHGNAVAIAGAGGSGGHRRDLHGGNGGGTQASRGNGHWESPGNYPVQSNSIALR